MTRPIAIASVVGGIILALGMLLLPFDAVRPPDSAATDAAADSASCGSLLSHYTSDPDHEGCNSVANDRAYMVIAGVVVAVLGAWSLKRSR